MPTEGDKGKAWVIYREELGEEEEAMSGLMIGRID